MQQIIDITGNTYNMLQVEGFDRCENGRSYWICRCECGKIVSLRKDLFAYTYSKQKSCGCYHRKESSKRMTEQNRNKKKYTEEKP